MKRKSNPEPRPQRRVLPRSYVLRFTLYVAAILSTAPLLPAAIDESKLPPASTNRVDFLRDIKPLLDASCLKCHGPEKPKGGFRIDNRAALLKGGDNGVAVIPGQSAKSPFIHFVARLVEDMEMPPVGKGDPLTPAQIGLLRAWIDQDLPWAGDVAGRTRVMVSPTLRWVSVDGDKQRFREHHWFREGWSGGLERFEIEQELDERTRALTSGRALSDDYSVTLSIERRGVGFVRGGLEEYKKWYDDSGGYYGAYTPPQFDLGRDLHLDIGKVWIEVGATAPFGTEFKVGFEYRSREGDKSLTRWLPAGPDTDPRRIRPNAKAIDETLHVIRFDVAHEWETLRLANSFRYEFNDIDTRHATVNRLQPDVSTRQRITESTRIENLANAFAAEKLFTDWLLVSGGYLYTHLDGDGDYNRRTVDAAGQPAFGSLWNGEGIALRRDAHVVNLNGQIGPWEGFTFTVGTQAEWNNQDTFGRVNYAEPDLIDPTVLSNNLSVVSGEIDRFIAQERAGVRYTKIPFTVLYAEGDWRQETIEQRDALLPGREFTLEAFSRDSDIDKRWQRYRAGFDVSPWARVAFNAWYQYFDRRTDFDQDVLDLFAFPPLASPSFGYVGFLERQDITTDEAGARLVLRPASWLKTALSYRIVATDYRNSTKPIPSFSAGGGVHAGSSDSQTFSLNASITPWQRLFLFTSFSFQELRTLATDHGNPSIAAWDGHICSALASASYRLNERTDAMLVYDFSYGDFGQNNAAAGLPLGLEYRLHTLRSGLSRELNKNLRAGLEYFFSDYDEPYSRGLNDYTAHGVFATLHFRWQ